MSNGLPRLWAVTPPEGPLDPSCFDVWRDAGAEGKLALWVRRPGLRPNALLEQAAALLPVAAARGIPVVIGVGCDALAEATAALSSKSLAGVVLRGDPDRTALAHARARLGPRAWIGRSAHRADAGAHALCTMTVLGPIFAPHTPKPEPATPLGLAAITEASAQVGARIVAVGGIDRAVAAPCVGAGAWGLAGIRSFFGPASEVAEDVAAFCTALQTATHGQAPPP